MKTTFKSGQWNVICDRCGFKRKSNDVREEWTGLMVCEECWEPRHPQDFIRSIPDDQTVPFTRPDDSSIDDADTYTDIEGTSYPPTYIISPDAVPDGTNDNEI